ncbi:MAG: GNAT family N-acetyltransferase [Candidatus Thorarchaeota archaeon]
MTDLNQRIAITELQYADFKFLQKLWHIPEVMRYADEFPSFRTWSKAEAPEVAWKKYQEKRHQLGNNYLQLILRLPDGTPIGESFFCAPPKGKEKLGRWKIPTGVTCLVGDIKLLPEYWNQGLGTEGMRLVVRCLFYHANCDMLIVPPHLENPAAKRVYEKAGFAPITGKSGVIMRWARHQLMKITKEDFQELY